MNIAAGGKTDNIGKTIENIIIQSDKNRTINLWINGQSLSYLTIKEALDLRDELNYYIRKACEL